MAAVAEIYQRIIYQQQTRSLRDAADVEFQLRSTPEPTTADQSNQQILERLASDAPWLYQIANRQDLVPQTRKNLFRFLSSAFTSSERYAAVLRHPEAVSRALALFETYVYLTDCLIFIPGECATLSELGETLSPVGGA